MQQWEKNDSSEIILTSKRSDRPRKIMLKTLIDLKTLKLTENITQDDQTAGKSKIHVTDPRIVIKTWYYELIENLKS